MGALILMYKKYILCIPSTIMFEIDVFYVRVYLSYVYLSIHPPIYKSSFLSICLSIYLSVCQSIHPPVCICISLFIQSICLSVYPSLHQSSYLLIYLLIYPSIFYPLHLLRWRPCGIRRTTSYHTSHTFKGIVKSQFIRFQCTCTN